MAVAPWIVSDRLWERIEPVLPKAARRFRYPGRKRLDDRAALQGILFVLHTGIAWRHLPLELGLAPVRPAIGGWSSGSGPASGNGSMPSFCRSFAPPASLSGRGRWPTRVT